VCGGGGGSTNETPERGQFYVETSIGTSKSKTGKVVPVL